MSGGSRLASCNSLLTELGFLWRSKYSAESSVTSCLYPTLPACMATILQSHLGAFSSIYHANMTHDRRRRSDPLLTHRINVPCFVLVPLTYITPDSEVILFSPCVLCVCNDVCPNDFSIKDWCQINNMLHEYSCGYLVLVVCYTLWPYRWGQQVENSSHFRIVKTPYIFIVQNGNKYYHNLWLTEHLSNT